MLSKQQRLTRRDFEKHFAAGRRYHNEYFTLVHVPSASFHGAVAVPKKLAPKAVTRNRLRRQIYDILRRAEHIHEAKGVYIVIVKKTAIGRSFSELQEQLHALTGSIHKTASRSSK